MPLLLWANWVDTSGSKRPSAMAQAKPPARVPARPMDDDDALAFAWIYYLRHYYRLEDDGQSNVTRTDKIGG